MNKTIALLIVLALVFGCASKENGEPGALVLGKDLVEAVETNGNITWENQTAAPRPEPEPAIKAFTISTDKPAYVSREKIKITAELEVHGEIQGTTIEVYGIVNSMRRQLLSQNKLLYLKNGTNEANFTFDLPYCSSCSGMPGGTYWVFAKAVNNNETLSESNCSFNFSAG